MATATGKEINTFVNEYFPEDYWLPYDSVLIENLDAAEILHLPENEVFNLKNLGKVRHKNNEKRLKPFETIYIEWKKQTHDLPQLPIFP